MVGEYVQTAIKEGKELVFWTLIACPKQQPASCICSFARLGFCVPGLQLIALVRNISLLLLSESFTY